MRVSFPLYNEGNNLINSDLQVLTVKGLPELKILGVKGEASYTLKEKLSTAIKTQGFALKGVRKVVYLKDVASQNEVLEQTELQIATMLLHRLKHICIPNHFDILFLGKLLLDGSITASLSDIQLSNILRLNPQTLIVVSAQHRLEHPNLIKITQLKDLSKLDLNEFSPVLSPCHDLNLDPPAGTVAFEDIEGFNYVKYVLVLTLALKGSMLLIGPSGTGKSMIFRSPGTLGYTEDDIITLDPTYTISQFKSLINSFEKNYNTQDQDENIALHKIFVLNELTDYKKTFLEYLKIFFDQIDASKFKHRYSLLASTNPCKCGNLGLPDKQCKCDFYQIKTYNSKIAFPLMDRFDFIVNLAEIGASNRKPIETDQALAMLIVSELNLGEVEFPQKFDEVLRSMQFRFGISERRLNKMYQQAKTISLMGSCKAVSEDTFGMVIALNDYIIKQNACQT